MKRYVLLLLATLTSFNLATAANVELRGRDLKKTAKGVEISHEVARLSGFLSDMLGQGVEGAIPVPIPHQAVELAAPNFLAAYEAYKESAGPRVTKELRAEHRKVIVAALLPRMQGLGQEELVLLINAADYFNFPELLEATAQRATQVLNWENIKYFKDQLHDVAPLSQAIVRQNPNAFFPLILDKPDEEQQLGNTNIIWRLDEGGKLALMIDEGFDYQVVEVDSGKTLLSKLAHDAKISADGTRAYYKFDQTWEVWDIRKKVLISKMQGESFSKEQLSKDGRLLLAVNEGDTINIWSTDTGEILKSFAKHNQARISDLAFTYDEKVVVVLFEDDTGEIRDAKTGRLLRTITGVNEGQLREIKMSPYGPVMAINGSADMIRIWNWQTGRLVGDIRKQGGWPAPSDAQPFSPDGNLLVRDSVGPGRTTNLSVWNISSQQELFNVFTHHSGMGATYSKDGSQIAVTTGRNIYLFDAYTGRPLFIFKHPRTPDIEGEHATFFDSGQTISDLHLSTDGKRLLTGFGNRVYTWNLKTPAIRTYLQGSLTLEGLLFIMMLYQEHQKDPKAAINLHKLAAKTPGVTGEELAEALEKFPPEISRALTARFKIVHPQTALRARRRRRYQRA